MNQAVTPLPPPVLDAIRSGRTIDAIRLLREATGMDLKSAKDLIDAHARGAAASVSYTQSPGGAKTVPASVVEALKQGRTVDAIKLLREHDGLGLKEAKAWIDAHRASGDLGADRQGLSPGEEPRAGNAGGWLMLVVFAVVGWLLLR
jgi:ribosomal protein L7/L12